MKKRELKSFIKNNIKNINSYDELAELSKFKITAAELYSFFKNNNHELKRAMGNHDFKKLKKIIERDLILRKIKIDKNKIEEIKKNIEEYFSKNYK